MDSVQDSMYSLNIIVCFRLFCCNRLQLTLGGVERTDETVSPANSGDDRLFFYCKLVTVNCELALRISHDFTEHFRRDSDLCH